MTEVPSAPNPPPGAVLVLGGTAEARALAAAATAAEARIVSSLAGRVSRPALPVGPVRIGGFGGVAGLTDYLITHRIAAVVDATHPFAATMSASAASACATLGLPLLRLARAGWSGRLDAGGWHWTGSPREAAGVAAALGSRVFLTTGRQTLGDFQPLEHRYALVRVVETPLQALPARWELVRDRGPYFLAGELDLMSARAVDVLVTKDSGGAYTSAKLDAAGRLGVPVVVVRRPPEVPGVQAVASAAEAAVWLRRHAGRGRLR